MNTDKIGKFIKQKRQEKNLTQKELALKLNITDRAVSKWERGLGCPDVSLLEDLSKILDISILELLNGEEIEELDNKKIINSINYSKDSLKLQIKDKLNTILISIIVLVSFILILFNIINYYKLNRKYHFDKIDLYKEQYNKDYNIVINNQGKYSKEDYDKIVKYLKKSKEYIDNIYDRYYIKDKISMKDYYLFKSKYQNDSHVRNLVRSNNSLYYTLIKYDNSDNLIKNMIQYNKNIDSLFEYNNSINELLKDSYKYSFKTYDDRTILFKYIITLEYINEERLLKDIIEVGELNEK